MASASVRHLHCITLVANLTKSSSVISILSIVTQFWQIGEKLENSEARSIRFRRLIRQFDAPHGKLDSWINTEVEEIFNNQNYKFPAAHLVFRNPSGSMRCHTVNTRWSFIQWDLFCKVNWLAGLLMKYVIIYGLVI